ncbi:MAG TPA: hypothetical protein DCO77_03830 [Nitrospiraceae bacterium]|nr:hypothetical protein [Nitrospiraceae bacterium]
MRRHLFFAATLFCMIGILCAGDGFAALYKYINKDGTIGFTDNLQSVPEEYRKTAVLVKTTVRKPRNDGKDPRHGIDNEDAPAAALHPASVPMGGNKAGGKARFSIRVLRSLFVIIVAALIILVLSRYSHLRDRKKVLHAVNGALIALVSLFVIYSHARDVVTLFTKTGNAIEDRKDEAREKGEGAARFIKALDAFFE